MSRRVRAWPAAAATAILLCTRWGLSARAPGPTARWIPLYLASVWVALGILAALSLGAALCPPVQRPVQSRSWRALDRQRLRRLLASRGWVVRE